MREMTEHEYAAEAERLANALMTNAAEEAAALKILDRIRNRVCLEHNTRTLTLQLAKETLETQWAEIQEQSTRCSKCGDRENAHQPTDPDYNIHIYLTQCREFVPYEAATTPPSVTRRMKSSQAKQRAREAFWSQNKPKPPKG